MVKQGSTGKLKQIQTSQISAVTREQALCHSAGWESSLTHLALGWLVGYFAPFWGALNVSFIWQKKKKKENLPVRNDDTVS